SLDKADNFPAKYRSLVDPDGDGKVDVSGGYHDAGDHVKFNLTMGFAGSSLALSDYLHPEVYKKAGAKEHLLKIVRRNADYLMKTTFLDTDGEVAAICHVVANGNVDHNDWSSPEKQTYERTTYWLSAEYNNSAVCGEMAAALAGCAWMYKSTDPQYYAECIRYAKALLKFGKDHQGNYKGGLSPFYDTADYYGSETIYGLDETAMAEAWLWLCGEGDKPVYEPNSGCYIYQGVYYGDYDFYSWNKVWQGFAALMYKKTNDAAYEQALKDAYNNKQGLSDSYYNHFDVTWGVSRYNCAMQMTALSLAKGDKDSAYAKGAKFQMDYIMGNNPYGYSFLIGYGNNPSKIHHRGANPDKGAAKYVLKGALIGGPDSNGYVDDVNSYQYTEPALDYNGCFALACSGLAELYGGSSAEGSPTPTVEPTGKDEPTPTVEPTGKDEPTPTVEPTGKDEPTPTVEPTGKDTPSPSVAVTPTVAPTGADTPSPSAAVSPTAVPTGAVTPAPSVPAELIELDGYTLAVKQKLDVAEIMLKDPGLNGISIKKYKCDLAKLASVSGKGIVKAKKEGSVVITGYKKEGRKYIPVACVKIEISKPVFKSVDADGAKCDLTYEGQTADLNGYISGLPKGQGIGFAIPSKTKSVSLEGSVLTARKNGNVKVSCIIGEGRYAAKYTAVFKVKFPKLKPAISLKPGKTKTVTIKNVSAYTSVHWVPDPALTLTQTKDMRKVKISAAAPGTYNLKAVIDGREYVMEVTAE
ncbi:MAG: glycoside hydrolase family 9 protein, partial [Lachnospiraceae bacterium]|nr:glycoside hydrolase family 9 protein [Lachnospiraceae bacterium]